VDEDCLYLNVYSPTVSTQNTAKIKPIFINNFELQTASGLAQPYPVMVYIHGGDFQRGASNLFPAHTLATFYDVVVVTINYRLGALGKSNGVRSLEETNHLF
jgi:neuroligin